mmetsp:Transcript_23881/g.43343  ORF Transcript_23881/g.43343 Transcript_23881/m.43343 type:complete len:92 (-) Transcript_23881:52-327(-)
MSFSMNTMPPLILAIIESDLLRQHRITKSIVKRIQPSTLVPPISMALLRDASMQWVCIRLHGLLLYTSLEHCLVVDYSNEGTGVAIHLTVC